MTMEFTDKEVKETIKNCYKGFLLDIYEQIQSGKSKQEMLDTIEFEMDIVKSTKTKFWLDKYILLMLKKMKKTLTKLGVVALNEIVTKEKEKWCKGE